MTKPNTTRPTRTPQPPRTPWPLRRIAIALTLAIGCTPTQPAPPSDPPTAAVDNLQTTNPTPPAATPAQTPAAAPTPTTSTDPATDPPVTYSIAHSRQTLAAFETSTAATGDEWHHNFIGPRATLYLREPITLETADRLIAAWDRPSHRLLTRAQDLQLHRCIRAIVSETVADFATANQTDRTRSHRLGPWLIELRLCTNYRDIPGSPSFASLVIEHPSDTMTARLNPQPIPQPDTP
jgi:hypothetical protein